MEIKGLSATGIKDFLQCPLKVVFRYDRDVLSLKNDFAKLGIAVHTALEQFTRRMLNKKSFPDATDYEFAVTTFMNSATEEGLESMGFYTAGKQMVTECIDRFDPSEEVLEVEHRFRITTPDGVPITGAIDKVVKVSDDTIAIVDYKTSKNAMPVWEIEDDVQLSMYDYAGSLIWPEYKNRLLHLEYVRINKRVSTYRTAESRETFNEFLNSTWLQMQKLREEEAVGRINNLCGWCDYKTYCPAYASFMKSKEPEMPQLANMGDAELLTHWEEVSEKKAVLEARQRELKMTVNRKFMEGHDIRGGGKELYSTQAARTNYDVDKVVEIVPQEDLYSLLTVNKGRVDRYVKDYPDLKSPLDRIAEVNYNAPVYKIRATKEDVDDDATISEDESAA
jgi:RecB family exonuclease